MDKRQHLFVKLMEECGETTQRTAKLLRFSEGEKQPGHDLDNLQRLQDEVDDIIATARMLGLSVVLTDEKLAGRVARFEKYLNRSREYGTLDE